MLYLTEIKFYKMPSYFFFITFFINSQNLGTCGFGHVNILRACFDLTKSNFIIYYELKCMGVH